MILKNLQNKIINLYNKIELIPMLIIFVISVLFINYTLLSFFRTETEKEIMNMLKTNQDYFGEITTIPETMLNVLPYIQMIATILFSILGVLILGFIIYIILKFNKENIGFKSCFSIALFSQLVFSVQFLIVGMINLLFDTQLATVVPSDKFLISLLNPFYLASLFILYTLVKDKTLLTRSQLLIFILVMIIYKIAGSL